MFNEIFWKGTSNHQILMISNNEKSEYSTEAYPKTYKYRKSYSKISFNDIQ